MKRDDFIGKKLGSVTEDNNERLVAYAKELSASNQEKIPCEIDYKKENKTYWNLLTLKKFNQGETALLISLDITEFKEALENVISKDPINKEKIKTLIDFNHKSFEKIDSIIKSVRNLVRDGSQDEMVQVPVKSILSDIALFI